MRNVDELVNELDRQPYGLPVTKAADAYPGAEEDIEVCVHALCGKCGCVFMCL